MFERRQNLITNIVFNSMAAMSQTYSSIRHLVQDRRVTRRSCRKPNASSAGLGESLQMRGHEDEQK